MQKVSQLSNYLTVSGYNHRIYIHSPDDGELYSEIPPAYNITVGHIEPVWVQYVLSGDLSLVNYSHYFDDPSIVHTIGENTSQTEFASILNDSDWSFLSTRYSTVRLVVRAYDANNRYSYQYVDLQVDTSPPDLYVVESMSKPYHDESAGIFIFIQDNHFNDLKVYVSDNASLLLWTTADTVIPEGSSTPIAFSSLDIETTIESPSGTTLGLYFNPTTWGWIHNLQIINLTIEASDRAGHYSVTYYNNVFKDTVDPWDLSLTYYVNAQDNISYFNLVPPTLSVFAQDNVLWDGDYCYFTLGIYGADENYTQDALIEQLSITPATFGGLTINFSYTFTWQQWQQVNNYCVTSGSPYLLLEHTLYDNAGNTISKEIRGYFDATNPNFETQTLPVFSKPAVIFYTIDDLNSHIYYILGNTTFQIAPNTTSGNFSVDGETWYNLNDGQVQIELWAEDYAGNPSGAHQILTTQKDTVAPDLMIYPEVFYWSVIAPQWTLYVSADVINLTTQVGVHGVYRSGGTSSYIGENLTQFPIQNGYYVINIVFDQVSWTKLSEDTYDGRVIATDAAGNVAIIYQPIIKDTTPPIISNIGVLGGGYHNVAPTLTWIASEPLGYINISYDEGVTWMAVDPDNPVLIGWDQLMEGSVEVDIAVADRARNPASSTFHLELMKDTLLPIFTISNPPKRAGADAPKVRIFASDSNLKAFYIKYDSLYFTFSVAVNQSIFDGSLSLPGWSLLGDGSHKITITASDGANNVSQTITIEKDIIGPHITVLAPTSGQRLGRIPPIYTITIDDPDWVAVWYRVDDSDDIPITKFSDTIDYDAWIDPPANITYITFFARDDLGNVYNTTVFVYRSDYGIYYRGDDFAAIFEHWEAPQIIVVVAVAGISFSITYPKYKKMRLEGV